MKHVKYLALFVYIVTSVLQTSCEPTFTIKNDFNPPKNDLKLSQSQNQVKLYTFSKKTKDKRTELQVIPEPKELPDNIEEIEAQVRNEYFDLDTIEEAQKYIHQLQSYKAKRVQVLIGDIVYSICTSAEIMSSNIPRSELIKLSFSIPSNFAPYKLFLDQDAEVNLNSKAIKSLFNYSAYLANPKSNFRMAIFNIFEKNMAPAITQMYFSALDGYVPAQIALGYRHENGLAVPKSCESALGYYSSAAAEVVKETHRVGLDHVFHPIKLSLGPLGPTEQEIHGLKGNDGIIDWFLSYLSSNSAQVDQEFIDYYIHSAERGDVDAMHRLGFFYLHGINGVEQNYLTAWEYFRRGVDRDEGLSLAMLGVLAMNNPGPKEDSGVESARKLFNQCLERGNLKEPKLGKAAEGIATNGLGYLEIYTTEKPDFAKARAWFTTAANNDNVDGIYNLGVLHLTGNIMGPGSVIDISTAITFFELAAKKRHKLSQYQMGVMNAQGIGIPYNCENAVAYFKMVIEQSDVFSKFTKNAEQLYQTSNPELALQQYLIGAELGSELAQNNAAVLLDKGVRNIYLENAPREFEFSFMEGQTTETTGKDEVKEDSFLGRVFGSWWNKMGFYRGRMESLRMLFLAAAQGNVRANLKLGDYFYYNFVDMKELESAVDHTVEKFDNLQLAAHYYRKAKDAKSIQGAYNLAHMYHYGLGVKKDFHLAKRYYDEARGENDNVAKNVPATLALLFLRFESLFDIFFETDFESRAAEWSISNLLRGFVKFVLDPTELLSFSGEVKKIRENENEDGDEQPKIGFQESSSSVQDGEGSAVEFDTILAIVLFLALIVVVLIRQSRANRRLRNEG
eukprot:snap_masked-scaffold_2-processed-gene-5.2-mRNA-1 protein AED:1.00 eAED:1.00 QI:0/0/0/0/1/1/2/0/847